MDSGLPAKPVNGFQKGAKPPSGKHSDNMESSARENPI